jgi:poly(hydroxyalkanoate) depolymerase family esterase
MMNLATGNWPFFGFNPWADLLATPDLPRTAPPGQGQFLSGSFQSASRSIDYKLYIPSGERNAPLPLVVMLHGCGQDASDFARGTGMNELAEQAQCLVLYPEQSSQISWNRCWNWYDQAHHERDEGEPALIADLTRTVIAQHAVDASRVSIAGLSSGGAMAVILGRTYPDLFQAVGCHSGLPHRSATSGMGALSAMRAGSDLSSAKQTVPLASIPIIVFHGDVDNTVHQKNSADVVQQSIECYMAQAPDESAEIAVYEETGEASGRSFTRHTHCGKTGDVVAEQWTIHGTGHAWSGGNLRGSYTDTRGPDASREMLRFFMRQ